VVVAKLTGAAQPHANWHELSETAAGVAKLQEIMGGRPDGASLLAKVAGIFIGAREGDLDESGAMGAAELCIAAGAGKTRKSLVLIAPTQHQLGQAQAVPDEHRTGVWEITKFSGAVSRERKTRLVENAEALLAALRQARERANHAGARRSASAARPSPSCSIRVAAGPRTLCTHPSRIEGGRPPGSCPRHAEAGRSRKPPGFAVVLLAISR
jgi:hypothetical protein